MKGRNKRLIPLFVLLGIGVAFLAGWIIQLLWNATITPIFDLIPITYWQGIMLLILCKILFSSHYNVHKEHSDKTHHRQPEIIRRQFQEEKIEDDVKLDT